MNEEEKVRARDTFNEFMDLCAELGLDDDWEIRYVAECERLGVKPYRCRAEDCDRAQPCRKHKDVPDIKVPE